MNFKKIWFEDSIPRLTELFKGENVPKTCFEFTKNERLKSAFCTLQEYPEVADLTLEEAIKEDEETNFRVYGVKKPLDVIENLSKIFENPPIIALKNTRETIILTYKIFEELIQDYKELEGCDHSYKQEALVCKQILSNIKNLADKLKVKF